MTNVPIGVHSTPYISAIPLNFARPEMLWLLGILPLLMIWGVRSARLRRRGWEALAQRGRPPGDGTAWWVASAAFTILALAQPKWGRDLSDQLPPGHDLVLLVDVSRSMGAEDAVPNRLGVAKEAARSLIKTMAKSPGNRAAVVAFAGRGVLRCPLTENSGAVIDALDRLKPGRLRPGGTDLEAGLEAALEAFDPQEHEDGRTVLVFSDGEDLVGRWEQSSLSEKLRKEKVIVHTLAIGDPEHGHPIPVQDAESLVNTKAVETPVPHTLTYHGEPVRSRRNDAPLEAIARRSGGTIVRLGLASTDLGDLYKTRIEPVALRTRAKMRIAERSERFPVFLMAGLLTGLIGAWPRSGRIRTPRKRMQFGRWITSRSWPWQFGRRAKPALQTAGAVVLLLAIAGAGDVRQDSGSGSAASSVAKGLEAYREGRYEEAQAAFGAAIREAPESAIPRYNRAATRFQLGQYDESLTDYLEARERAGPALRTKIDFALGNAAVASGDFPSALRYYDACLASTEPGEDLDAVRQDAAINRAFALEQTQSPAADQVAQHPEPQAKRERPEGSEKREGAGNVEAEGPDATTPPGGPKTGGAGGEGARGKAHHIDPNSPERQLDAALEHIRDARRRRLPADETPPDPGAQDDRKDW